MAIAKHGVCFQAITSAGFGCMAALDADGNGSTQQAPTAVFLHSSAPYLAGADGCQSFSGVVTSKTARSASTDHTSFTP
ncbi:MAG TPA: hypothetical protein PL024_08470 [Thauera sp.]|nr:hypothetical protein [Thauera sp.]